MRIAVIELASGIVRNVAEVEEGDGSTVPDGFLHIPSDSANAGDTWDGAEFIKKPEAPFVPRTAP